MPKKSGNKKKKDEQLSERDGSPTPSDEGIGPLIPFPVESSSRADANVNWCTHRTTPSMSIDPDAQGWYGNEPRDSSPRKVILEPGEIATKQLQHEEISHTPSPTGENSRMPPMIGRRTTPGGEHLLFQGGHAITGGLESQGTSESPTKPKSILDAMHQVQHELQIEIQDMKTRTDKVESSFNKKLDFLVQTAVRLEAKDKLNVPDTRSETDVSDRNQQNVNETNEENSLETQDTERVPLTPRLTAAEKGKGR